MSSCISPWFGLPLENPWTLYFKVMPIRLDKCYFLTRAFPDLRFHPATALCKICAMHIQLHTHTCEPLCTALVTPSQHLRRWDVGKPKQVVMSNSDKKCWHVCLFLPLSDKKKSCCCCCCCFPPPLKQLCYCGLFILLEGISNPLMRGAWKMSVVFSLQQLWQEQHEKPATGFALSLSCVAIQAHGARTVTNDLKLLNYSIFACCHQFHCLFFY